MASSAARSHRSERGRLARSFLAKKGHPPLVWKVGGVLPQPALQRHALQPCPPAAHSPAPRSLASRSPVPRPTAPPPGWWSTSTDEHSLCLVAEFDLPLVCQRVAEGAPPPLPCPALPRTALGTSPPGGGSLSLLIGQLKFFYDIFNFYFHHPCAAVKESYTILLSESEGGRRALSLYWYEV